MAQTKKIVRVKAGRISPYVIFQISNFGPSFFEHPVYRGSIWIFAGFFVEDILEPCLNCIPKCRTFTQPTFET